MTDFYVLRRALRRLFSGSRTADIESVGMGAALLLTRLFLRGLATGGEEFCCDPGALRREVFPLRPQITDAEIAAWLGELAVAKLVVEVQSRAGQRFGQIAGMAADLEALR